jgi:hypothetical protein
MAAAKRPKTIRVGRVERVIDLLDVRRQSYKRFLDRAMGQIEQLQSQEWSANNTQLMIHQSEASMFKALVEELDTTIMQLENAVNYEAIGEGEG